MSKKRNFYIKLSDKDFLSLINNNYFKENLNIEIDNLINEIIPKIPSIKDNKKNENEFSFTKPLQIPNQNLFRLSFGLYVDKIFFKYLNEKKFLKMLKSLKFQFQI